MRLVLSLLIVLVGTAVGAAKPTLVWEAKGLSQPESVIHDPVTDVYYVTNINGAVMQKNGRGFITRVQPDGTILERSWVEGLHAPTGLALRDRTLYVADVDQLLEINAASGAVTKRHKAKGAVFLNDVALAEDGSVYVSDTPMNTIWRLQEGSFEPWLTDDGLSGPNGLLVQGDRIIVASFGKMPSEGQSQELAGLFSVSIEDQKVKPLGKNRAIGNLDGIALDSAGNYLVTDWANGGLFKITPKGKVTQLLDLNQGSADLTTTPDKSMVLIPLMLDNTLAAYRLDAAGKKAK